LPFLPLGRKLKILGQKKQIDCKAARSLIKGYFDFKGKSPQKKGRNTALQSNELPLKAIKQQKSGPFLSCWV